MVALHPRLDQPADLLLEIHHLAEMGQQLVLGERVPVAVRVRPVHPGAVHALVQEVLPELAVVLEVILPAPLAHAVERRLGDQDVAVFHQGTHVAEQEGQQQRADVQSVVVGVRHDDDASVTQPGQVEILVYADPECGDDGLELVVAQHRVDTGLLHVERLPPERQDGLEGLVAARLGRTAGRIALDEVDLAGHGILQGAVGQLAGQRGVLQRALPAGQLPRLAGGVAGNRRLDAFLDDLLRRGRMFFQVRGKAVADHRLHHAADIAVAELLLGLALELGIGYDHAHDGGDAFPRVVAGYGHLEVLQQVVPLGVVVDGSGEGRLEAHEVEAALRRAHGVGVGEDVLLVAVVVLKGDVDLVAVPFLADPDGVMDGGLVLVQVLDELDDAAPVLENGRFAPGPVVQLDAHVAVQEGQLAEAVGDVVEIELRRVEDLVVGLEGDGRPVLLRLPPDLEVAGGDALLVTLVIDLPVPAHLHDEPFRQGVDHGHAHAVQAARYLVGLVVELPAGVEHGHDDFHGRPVLRGVRLDRYAAAVVDHGYTSVFLDVHLDRIAEPLEMLIDGVLHHFFHEMMQAGGAGAPDVHGGPLANAFESLQDLDILRVILIGVLGPGDRLRDFRIVPAVLAVQAVRAVRAIHAVHAVRRVFRCF